MNYTGNPYNYSYLGTGGMRFLPMNNDQSKKTNSHVLIIPDSGFIPGSGFMPDSGFGLMPSLLSPVISPVLGPGIPVFPSGIPGAYIEITPVGSGAAPAPAPAAGAAGAGAGAAGAAAPGAATSSGQSYNISVITPPITNIRQISFPDNDPELRRKVVKYFYDKLKDIYFHGKFQKLLKYIVIENNTPRLVKSYEELQKNIDNKNDISIRIKFITENIFSKYDLEVLISKLIQKYGMLFSDDEYNMHWYNAKNKYSNKVKKAMYKKIKYRLQKKVHF